MKRAAFLITSASKTKASQHIKSVRLNFTVPVNTLPRVQQSSFHANRFKLQEKKSEKDEKSAESVFEEILSRASKMLSIFATTETFEGQDLQPNMMFRQFQFNVYKSLYDKEFKESEFLEGATQAVKIVKPLLISRDVERLQPLLTPACFDSIRKVYERYDKEQVTVEGTFEDVISAKIRNMRIKEVDRRLDTVVNVQFATKECLFAKKDGKVVLGHEEVKERICIASFERQGIDGLWKIRGIVS